MKNILAIFKYLPALTSLITAVEEAFGPKNGTTKKKAVIDAFTAILSTAAPFVEVANPAYASIISDAVDFLVKQLNTWAGLSDATQPVPQPAPADPYYATVFASIDAAKAAGKTGDEVYGLPDGTDRLIPGGVGGTPITATHPDWTLVATV